MNALNSQTFNNSDSKSSSHLHALLIGINRYLPNRLPDNQYYRDLKGCVRDVNRVKSFLQQRLNVPDANISTLTAGNLLQSSDSQDRLPSYENMVAAFQTLTAKAEPGDRVYIHYSGHGGRTPTHYPKLKGKRGLDECLVPYNIGQPGSRYLRDIELAHLLDAMVNKELLVTIVLDSCHSGGATRDPSVVLAPGIAARGANVIDPMPRSQESLVASDEVLTATWRKLSTKRRRDFELGKSGWFPEPDGYVLLAACRPSEFAYEYSFSDWGTCGVLTYWLIEALEQLGTQVTYRQVCDRITAKMYSRFQSQTPLIEGECDRILFSEQRLPALYTINVLEVNLENQWVKLNTGKAQAVQLGAQFAIYPAEVAEFSQHEQCLARVEVTELDALRCQAKIIESLPSNPISPGDRAILLNPGASLRSTVRLINPTSTELPPLPDRQAALDRVKQALNHSGRGFVTLTQDNRSQVVDYQVTVNAAAAYEVRDAAGQPIPHLRPPLPVDEPDAAVRVVQRLVHLTKYRNIQQLENPNVQESLQGKLQVELFKAAPTFDPQQVQSLEDIKRLSFERSADLPEIQVDEWMFAQVTNTSNQVLNIVALCLQSDWGVQQLYPRIEDMTFWPFDPGQSYPMPLRARLPEGQTEGINTIKVFATGDATQFRWLELPPLDRPLQQSNVHNRDPANPLEALLAMMGADTLTDRAGELLNANWGWITEQRVVRIQRQKNG